MAAKLSTYEKSEIERTKTSDVNFRFGEKDDLQPVGFSNLGPGKPATIILKGKVKNFSDGDEWDKSKRFTLDMTSCEIVAPVSEVTMDDALKAANATRKKVGK